MSSQPYQQKNNYNPHLPDDHYRHLQWGTNVQSSNNPNILYSPRSHTDYFQSQKQGDDHYTVNVDYSQVAAVQTGFKKLKSNQIEILKELRRQYEVLRNTQLESGRISTIRIQTDNSGQSIDDSVSKSRSDARSSSYSRAEKTRKKSHHKQMEIAVLERKQMEMMLNNSMKKIQQLLSAEIQLKKNISDLKNKLEAKDNSIDQYEEVLARYKSQIQKLNRSLQECKKEGEAHRVKSKQLISSLGSLEGELAIAHVQIKKKDDRIRALQEQIYSQKNRFCNLELDLKKYKLQAEMLERNHKEQLSILQRRVNSSQSFQASEKDDQIRKLSKQLDLKQQRYRLLLNHFNQQKQEKQQLMKNKQRQQDVIKDQKQAKHDKEYIQQLQELIQQLKQEKNKRATASEEVMTSILLKVNEMNSKPNQDLVEEINMLKRQLQLIHTQAKTQSKPTINEEQLQQKLKQLEQTIEDENVQKLYFIEDLKRIRGQLKEEKKQKLQAKSEIQELKHTLRRVEEEARKYSYQLQTLRHVNELDITESRQQARDIMRTSQQLQSRQQELSEIKNELSRIVESNRFKVNEYEDEIKNLKRQLAQQQVKNFKIKQQLELKLNLTKTEHQAELARLQQQLQKAKKVHAAELNEYVNGKIVIEEKLLQKTQELDQVNSQLSSYIKEKDSVYQEFRGEQDKKLKSMQEEHKESLGQLVQKLDQLAGLNEQHIQIVNRNSYLQQQLIEMKRIVRHNRHINDGVDHLWSIKQAEYSNLHAVLKELE